MDRDDAQRWNVLFAFVNGRAGAPGVRSINPGENCTDFEPIFPKHSGRGDCDTDGHYLCDECAHRKTCPGCGLRPIHCDCKENRHG